MIYIVVGHRGSGKSTWLKVIQKAYQEKNKNVICFDLDKEIERESGKSIKELFLKGESFFRDWEKKIFAKILKNISQTVPVYIAVGAGFKFKKTDQHYVIFLRRLTDGSKKFFLNRPELSDKMYLNNYPEFHKKREEYFLQQSDEVFYRLEHFKDLQKSDLLFLNLEKYPHSFFSLQLNPNRIPKKDKDLKIFLENRLNRGVRFFEIHDQSANKSFVKTIRKFVPESHILFSSYTNESFLDIPRKQNWSWDLKLGEPPEGVSIVSLHERSHESLESQLKEFSYYKKYHLKLAIPIHSLKELEQGYRWQQENPKWRSFLPRSQEGRWRWFRNAFGSQMLLHFVREESSPILDQPLFSEAIHFFGAQPALGGVLGYPIDFSATPSEQNSFFYKERSIPIFPIPLKEEELTHESLKFFEKLGFVFFAVTSPCKNRTLKSAHRADNKIQDLESGNTLIYHDKRWKAYNTDIEAFKFLEQKIKGKQVCVWGGGGVRSSLKKIFPQACFYSARTGKLLHGQENKKIDILIWAVGRNRMKTCLWPPKDWTPRKIIDLNYSEDSPGREYALNTGIPYEDGYFIFQQQAQKQREIFLRLNNEC